MFFRQNALLVLAAYTCLVQGRLRTRSLAINLATPSLANWSSIVPSDNITWSPCLDNYQCARLSVPLDYSTPSGPKAEIALQLLPASNSTAPRGTILVNPGGPGGSGTEFLSTQFERLRNLTGPDFAILGFDPRGTGGSTPSAYCFDSELAYYSWIQNVGADVSLNASDGSVPMTRSRSRAVGELCARVIGGNGTQSVDASAEEWGIARFMDTATVARDMLTITEKLGQDKLLYYGVSYGTMLGQYFATLFPDRIGRMVLDGVLDGETAQTLQQTGNFVSTDAVFDSFFIFCHAAGPQQCSFYAPSPEAIRARYERIMNSLLAKPLALPFASGGPSVVSASYLLDQIFIATYDPLDTFPILAEGLLAIESNNQTVLSSLAPQGSQDIAGACALGDSIPYWMRQNQAGTAVSCSDAMPINDTDEQFDAYLQRIVATSKVAGPIMAGNRLDCDEWLIRPKSRYSGRVAADNTSSPILFVSNKYDPVCPLASAQAVQKRFKGSGLLVQNAYGHTATGSNVSPCTYEYVREYLVNGTLPKAGTVCAPGMQPFGAPINATT